MVTRTKMDCVVLFEDEVRAAAKLLRQFFDLSNNDKGESVTDDQYQAAGAAAIRAAYVALDGAENDAAIVLLGRKPTTPNEKVRGDPPALSAERPSSTDGLCPGDGNGERR